VEELRYPGTCRGPHALPESERRARPHALRFRVPEGPIEFVDRIAGPRVVDVAREFGDFMI
jgi:hypothetical protein